jgi:cysteine-rich repeat protein
MQLVTSCGGGAQGGDAGGDDDGSSDPCAAQSDGAASGSGMVCMSHRCVPSTAACGNGVVDPGEQCDDGNAVAFDGCEPGSCTPTCRTDTACDDANECNGVETCAPCATDDCASGRACTVPTPLDDGTSCTLPGGGTGKCRAGRVCVTASCGDGHLDAGESCDDGNATDGDGCESDCRFTCEVDTTATQTWYVDCDGDGYAGMGAMSREQCLRPEPADCGGGWTTTEPNPGYVDCDDRQATKHPGAPEVCDGRDDDCDGTNDDGCTTTPCSDGSECESGYCVDGVCCDSACTGQCEACDVMPGICTGVVGAPHGSRPACAGGGTVCGGACDGTNRTACDYADTSI